MQGNVETISDLIGLYALNIVIAVVIFVVGKWLAKKLTSMVIVLVRKNPKIDETLITFLRILSIIY